VRGSAQECAGVRKSARECAGVRGSARECVGVRGSARECVGVRGSARECVGVRGSARECVRVCGSVWEYESIGVSHKCFFFFALTTKIIDGYPYECSRPVVLTTETMEVPDDKSNDSSKPFSYRLSIVGSPALLL